jgi:hypothetical protein
LKHGDSSDDYDRDADRKDGGVPRHFSPCPFRAEAQVFLGEPLSRFRRNWDEANDLGNSAIEVLLIKKFLGAICASYCCAHGTVSRPVVADRRAIQKGVLSAQ